MIAERRNSIGSHGCKTVSLAESPSEDTIGAVARGVVSVPGIGLMGAAMQAVLSPLIGALRSRVAIVRAHVPPNPFRPTESRRATALYDNLIAHWECCTASAPRTAAISSSCEKGLAMTPTMWVSSAFAERSSVT
jgi:hypothetical protein